MPENVAAATLDDAFCEEIAMQSIIDAQSYRIAAHIASNSSVDRLRIFSTASTFALPGAQTASAVPLFGRPVQRAVSPRSHTNETCFGLRNQTFRKGDFLISAPYWHIFGADHLVWGYDPALCVAEELDGMFASILALSFLDEDPPSRILSADILNTTMLESRR